MTEKQDMGVVTDADRDLRQAILIFLIKSMERPCSEGDMIDDRNDELDAIIARHRLASQADQGALRQALEWALPLAERAVDDHRLERLRCGHSDIHGTYKSGVTWAGIHQSEVDQIEHARAAIAATHPQPAEMEARITGEALAAAINPALFCDDPHLRHMAASPLKVDAAQRGAVAYAAEIAGRLYGHPPQPSQKGEGDA